MNNNEVTTEPNLVEMYFIYFLDTIVLKKIQNIWHDWEMLESLFTQIGKYIYIYGVPSFMDHTATREIRE